MIAIMLNNTTITSWIVYSMVIGAVVMVAAVAAHDVQRSANRPVRWIWLGAMLATVTLCVLAPYRAHSVAPTLVEDAATMPIVVDLAPTPTNAIMQWWTAGRAAVVAPIQATLEAAQRRLHTLPAGTSTVVMIAWLVVSFLVAAGLLLSYRRMVRRVREFPHATIGGVSVRISTGVGPAVVGLAPSEIVVPSWLTSRSPQEQHIVVTHEVEHIRAADPWMLAVACIAVALMPWNAALWYALARLRLAIEIDCDQRVLRHGVQAHTYGSLLIDLTAVRPSLPIAMPAFPGTQSHLERRIIAMTEKPAKFLTVRRLASAGVAATIFVTACESSLPTSAEVARMDVASAETQLMKVGLIDTSQVAYFVDGHKVKEQLAKNILADSITSVSVFKARKDGVNEVHIATLHSNDSVTGLVVRGRSTADPTATPLIVIDGIISEASSIASLKMSPNRIESVEVVKGAEAQRRFDHPRAVNGVIIVKTKK